MERSVQKEGYSVFTLRLRDSRSRHSTDSRLGLRLTSIQPRLHLFMDVIAVCVELQLNILRLPIYILLRPQSFKCCGPPIFSLLYSQSQEENCQLTLSTSSRPRPAHYIIQMAILMSGLCNISPIWLPSLPAYLDINTLTALPTCPLTSHITLNPINPFRNIRVVISFTLSRTKNRKPELFR